MAIQKEAKKMAPRLRKARLVVVSRQPGPAEEKNVFFSAPGRRGYPMPPVNEFNTGYLKGKEHDPL